MGAAAERSERVAVLLVFVARFGEAFGIELLRVGPQLGETVVQRRPRHDRGALGDVVPQQVGVAHGLAEVEGQRGLHPQRLVDHQIVGLELVERLDVQRAVSDALGLLAQPLLPQRVGREVIGHRGQRRRRGVVRSHHQKDHVADDIVVGEALAVLVLRVAQHAEHVGALRAPLLADTRVEVILQRLARLDAAPPTQRRHRFAHDGVARPRGGGECLIDRGNKLLVGAGLMPHEHHRGDVEGQLLDVGIEQEAGIVGDPVVGDHRRGHRVDVLDVSGQAAAGERFLHDPAVVHVIVEVAQHEPALEERPDHRIPGAL